MLRHCMLSSKHETKASLSVSVLPHSRAATPSCSNLWLRSLYLQLGVAPAYYKHQQRIGYHETSAQLTLLKKHLPWLNEVSSVPLQQTLSHLDNAFRNFFEGRSKYPTFKKR